MDIRVFNTYGDTFLALGAGQVEAVFAGDAIGKYYQDKGKFTMAVTGLFPGSPGAFATIEPELGTAIADVLNDMLADGTYVETTPEGARTGGGTWRIGERGAMCFDPEGEQAEECYAGGEPSADGTFELRTADGTLAASVRLVGADAPAPANDASEAAAAPAQ